MFRKSMSLTVALLIIGLHWGALPGDCGNMDSHPSSGIGPRLQSLLDRTVAGASETPGAVMAVYTPSFQWVGAGGLANVQNQTAMQASDTLRIASITKTLVAVTVLKLVEEGKIDLDEKMGIYLPSSIVSRITNGSDITVRQLLDMTSGIYDYVESDAYNDEIQDNPYRELWTPEEILEYAYGQAAYFSPGQGWEYSNTNYILLEMIVKQVSGSTLAQEMRRIIHTPLDLAHTFMELVEPRQGGFGGLTVRGYDRLEDVTEINDALGLGDGGIISNPGDLATFLLSVFVNKSVLSQSSLDRMTTFHSTEDYGLGLERRNTQYGEAWGHNGASGGFGGDMLCLPEKGIAFAVLTNDFDQNIGDSLFQESMRILAEASAYSPYDFNGDSYVDIPYRHPDTGDIGVWFMNGVKETSWTLFKNTDGNPARHGTAWDIQGVGDFNNDDQNDAVYRHSNGNIGVWLMNGVSETTWQPFTDKNGHKPANHGSWDIKGLADFNNDGYIDALYRHPGTGGIGVWFMKGAKETIWSLITNPSGTPANHGLAWDIKALADFNNDGRQDILYKHSGGNVGIWLMNGTAETTWRPVTDKNGRKPANHGSWDIKGARDFNNDGRPDVLYRHPDTGAIGVWLMDGASETTWKYIDNHGAWDVR